MSVYKNLIRPLLFHLDAEVVHHRTVEACHLFGAVPGLPAITRSFLELRDNTLRSQVAGLHFDNPIGLAAGWDKNGRALTMLDAMGFGFAEIGSISARPSHGNPKPRLFRLPQDHAIIVNYGLPNDGAEVIAARLAKHKALHPIGINIVKTNDGPDAPTCNEDEILADYEFSVRALHRYASYLSLNLSCPNAQGGKDYFAQPGSISRLLSVIEPLGIQCPVFLKIAPRDSLGEHERILVECEGHSFVKGFCFNLPAGKPETLQFTVPRKDFKDRPGAVAGRPVEALINRCISGFYSRMDRQRYALIGAGGVFTADDAYRKICLGASLIQLYTAFVYEGPLVTRRICQGLAQRLKRDGFASVNEAVGSGLQRRSECEFRA